MSHPHDATQHSIPLIDVNTWLNIFWINAPFRRERKITCDFKLSCLANDYSNIIGVVAFHKYSAPISLAISEKPLYNTVRLVMAHISSRSDRVALWRAYICHKAGLIARHADKTNSVSRMSWQSVREERKTMTSFTFISVLFKSRRRTPPTCPFPSWASTASQRMCWRSLITPDKQLQQLLLSRKARKHPSSPYPTIPS